MTKQEGRAKGPAPAIHKKEGGTLGNLEYILPENKLDEIAITLSLKDYDYLEGVVDICEKSGVHTKAAFVEISTQRL